MTPRATIDPCACGGIGRRIKFDDVVRCGKAIFCEECGRTGFSSDTAEGAAAYWNAGERGKRADW
jgi:hypothetical protein